MDDRYRDRVVQFCQESVGDPLRSVFAYETVDTSIEPSVLYVREDVRSAYSERAFDQAVRSVLDEVAMEGLTTSWFEKLHRFGDMSGTVRVFDEATVVNVWFESGGLMVSWDSGAPVDLEPFVKELRKSVALPFLFG